MHWGAWGAGHSLCFLISIAIIGLLIWGITQWLSTRDRRSFYFHPGVPPAGPAQPSAMEILRQRYARGEIDTVTFNQMRERLGQRDEGTTF